MSDALKAAACPCCGLGGVRVFYRADAIPVNSTLQLSTAEEAVSLARGEMALGFCGKCGFICNTAFDYDLIEYSSRCEETQGFSPSFSKWQQELASRMVDRYELHDKTIVEIGCGKGEFLTALCEIGDNRGIGFDPAYIPERNTSPASDRIDFIREFYTSKNAPDHGDFIVCKMTLEHIEQVREFTGMVRRSIGDRMDTIVFFQVPDLGRILDEMAFWDIYYEHCSYFGSGSLEGLFRRSGFDVMDIDTDFGGQYLMLQARPADMHGCRQEYIDDGLEGLADKVERFRKKAPGLLQSWRGRLREWKGEGRRVVVWGSGSKGVSFLTSLGVDEEIDCVVDINPNRSGHFMAGSGHEIVTPERLRRRPPDTVILMNPLYRAEVQLQLDGLELNDVEVLTTTGN